MATVIIEGHGTFSVNTENLRELLLWLEQNKAAKIESEQTTPPYSGDTLLNESSS